MKAALLTAIHQPFRIEEVSLDPPQEREVQVQIAACGVCHSDWHLMTGDTRHPLPAITGHEGSGVVTAIGAGTTSVKVGDHVVLSWAPRCGECFYCQAGRPQLCDYFMDTLWDGRMRDGTSRVRWNGTDVLVYCGLGCFAEQVVVPEEACVAIDIDIPLRTAALLGCAVATGAGAVLRTAQVKAGDSVVVFGCGGVGVNALQAARLAGADPIIAVDPLPSRREQALRFGATHTLEPGDDLAAKVRDLTTRGADHAFEAAGVSAAQEQAIDCIRPGGEAILVGLTPMATTIPVDTARLTREEKSVRGSYYGSLDCAKDFPYLLDLYRLGKLDLDAMVSQSYALEDLNRAFADMLEGSGTRGVVEF